MSAVLVFGTCVPVEGVRALADDGAAQSVASQGESPLNQRGGQGGSDSNGASSQDSASAGEKDQDVPASKSVSRKDSGTSPPAQGDKPSAAPAAAQAKKTAAANASAAPASLVAVYVDGTNGNDANDGSSFDGKAVKTLAKALQIQAANKSVDTIYVKGSLSLSATASIPSGATLSVASEGATISGSGNSIDGIVLKSGSTLTGAGKLTMTGFKTALTSEKGSTITDGTYVLKDNAGKSGALFGAQASGSIVFLWGELPCRDPRKGQRGQRRRPDGQELRCDGRLLPREVRPKLQQQLRQHLLQGQRVQEEPRRVRHLRRQERGRGCHRQEQPEGF